MPRVNITEEIKAADLARNREYARDLKYRDPEQYTKRLEYNRKWRQNNQNRIGKGKSKPLVVGEVKTYEVQEFAPFTIPADEIEAWNRAKDRWL